MTAFSVRSAIFFAAGLLAVGLSTSAQAQSSGDDRDLSSLRGLPGVEVVVHDFKGKAGLDRVHATDIRTDVELKLRLAGIRVLTPEESSRASAHPALNIYLTTLKSSDHRIYAREIAVREVLEGRTFTDAEKKELSQSIRIEDRAKIAERVNPCTGLVACFVEVDRLRLRPDGEWLSEIVK